MHVGSIRYLCCCHVSIVTSALAQLTLCPPDRVSGFVFRDWAHDHGTKHVFGLTFRDDGKDEGIKLLKFLANEHATMHHVSAKLCARFVADEPPDGCVDAAMPAWQQTHGDIRAVL